MAGPLTLLRPLNDYMVSDAGQAAATWLSAGLSLVAIVIALLVALAEQRRANADRLREIERVRLEEQRRQERADAERSRYVTICVSIIERAITQLQKELTDIEQAAMGFVEWSMTAGVPITVAPMLDALKAMQGVWHDDPGIVLSVSRAVRLLDELVTPPRGSGIDTAPSKTRASNYVSARLASLRERRDQLVDELSKPAVLRS